MSSECIEIQDEDIIEELTIEDCYEVVARERPLAVRVAGVEGGEIDSQTDLDLGLAFREMGLLDLAVARFRKALHQGGRRVYCHMMIGLCYLDEGRVAEGIRELKDGLYLEEVTRREEVGLLYELGEAYRSLGEDSEALYYYRRVARLSSGFRDVRRRLSDLAPTRIVSNRAERSDLTPLFCPLPSLLAG